MKRMSHFSKLEKGQEWKRLRGQWFPLAEEYSSHLGHSHSTYREDSKRRAQIDASKGVLASGNWKAQGGLGNGREKKTRHKCQTGPD